MRYTIFCYTETTITQSRHPYMEKLLAENPYLALPDPDSGLVLLQQTVIRYLFEAERFLEMLEDCRSHINRIELEGITRQAFLSGLLSYGYIGLIPLVVGE